MAAEIAAGATRRPAELVAGEATSIGDLLRRRVAATPDALACLDKIDGEWRRTTWSELHSRVRRVASGLVDLGLAVGERVAILGPTSTRWAEYDLGGHLAGLVTIGIYPLQAPEQVRYLLEHSEARVVFVAGEDELQTVLAAADGLASVLAIVPWQEELAERFAAADPRVTSPRRFSSTDPAAGTVAERLEGVAVDDVAILIYTSGTTGPPKAAMITHANVLALLRSQGQVFEFFADDLMIGFLPMAHATERVMAFYARLNTGVATAYASSIGAVLAELGEVRPTVFGSVPRLFEKAYAKIQGEIARKPAPVRGLFAWADGVARRRLRARLAGQPVNAFLEWRYRLARKLVFGRIHAAFGGRVRACITGAAPIGYEILEFFWAVGLPIYEAYGMTEATVVTHINRTDAMKLGTVGRVIPPLECRIAEDGEVLLRGPFVFPGYFKDEGATAEAVVDGWLHSGDIGELDDDGFLRITDRKKHLIITAGGKNVAPANIERAIKSQSPLISQVHAHGDRRPYITALIAPSPLETLAWGEEHGVLDAAQVAELSAALLADPQSRSPELNAAMARVAAERRFHELFLEPVRRGNRDLARVERVRRFIVLDRDFSLEGGELTPTMKMKRRVIESKYQDLLQRAYSEPDFAFDAEPASS